MKTVTSYRSVNQEELDLVKKSGYKEWPPRLPEQPIFYPVTNEKYAREINRWNVKDYSVGYITRFEVKKNYLDHYEIKTVGAVHATEWWIPAEDLIEFNKNIVGKIIVIEKMSSTSEC